MKQLPDAAVQAFIERYEIGCNHQYDENSIRAALTAALPYLSAPCVVEVVELEWVQDNHGSIEFTAQSIFGEYSVHIERKSAYECSLDGVKYERININHPYTVDQAKAAAQTDFERRVRECLVDKPVDVAAVREQALDENELQEIADGAWGDGPMTRGAARDRIRALSVVPAQGEQWRDIATAPNHQSILIHYDHGKIELVDADDNDYSWAAYTGKENFCTKPTHWMPLPATPTTEADK